MQFTPGVQPGLALTAAGANARVNCVHGRVWGGVAGGAWKPGAEVESRAGILTAQLLHEPAYPRGKPLVWAPACEMAAWLTDPAEVRYTHAETVKEPLFPATGSVVSAWPAAPSSSSEQLYPTGGELPHV